MHGGQWQSEYQVNGIYFDSLKAPETVADPAHANFTRKTCKIRKATFSVILQHFATKLVIYTNFKMLFLTVVKDITLITL